MMAPRMEMKVQLSEKNIQGWIEYGIFSRWMTHWNKLKLVDILYVNSVNCTIRYIAADWINQNKFCV